MFKEKPYTDLFKIFIELMGAREWGVRITAIVPEQRGELAVITNAIAEAGGSFLSFTQFAGKSSANREIVFKVHGLDVETVVEKVTPLVEQIIDARSC